MNARAVLGAVMIGVCLTGARAWGQDLSPPSSPVQPGTPIWDAPRDVGGIIASETAQPAGTATQPGAGAPAGPHGPAHGGLSDWILYRKCESCFGPLTPTPRPLCMEIFLRAGPSVAVGGTKLGRDLQTGWAIQGGGRALLYNTEMTRAFTLEAHLINMNNSSAGEQPANLSIFVPDAQGNPTRVNFGEGDVPPVTIRRYNRTLVGLGIGRERYLRGTAIDPGTKWRVGWDWGGRWGSAKMDFNEIRHRTDVIGAMYVGAHTDLEIPCGPCSFVTGLRFEWSHTWSDILQRATDVQDLTTMLNFGLRY